jgi:hypothetical protein
MYPADEDYLNLMIKSPSVVTAKFFTSDSSFSVQSQPRTSLIFCRICVVIRLSHLLNCSIISSQITESFFRDKRKSNQGVKVSYSELHHYNFSND